jgi:extracellular matrix regulatory protein B
VSARLGGAKGMFLHIGSSQIVFNRELIGIFDFNLKENPANREFLKNISANPLNKISSSASPKAFVVTDKGVYISPITPLTLSRRRTSSL